MSIPETNAEIRIIIEPLPPEPNQVQDQAKNDTPVEINNAPPERITQVLSGMQQASEITSLPTPPQNNQHSSQSANLPLSPPPYSELPIFTIPTTNHEGLIYDPPPPYDPTMRREAFDPIDFPYQGYQQNRTSSRFECKPDTLVPLGFCYCTLEQLIVTLAILGTFLFLGLGRIS
ncbi:uncharacterized protein LOC123316569 [Coccinella septempunctata]|uniref:uncharacterized protein LOC123316569 n=1 Tax=Coccinella septempunctata TaxID=41139 RepID=UPI001D0656AC|nr:uncharacterized protein LOC123316569 [Coccinella septempunctata]XP_044758648.1 uncharacterized protein LOC123316569 [Coccinella septempunctata]XP_044758649.1 uncharacterized protein LOC123316569 [Coccinella septempunctata]